MDPRGQRSIGKADLVAANAQFSWPPAFSSLAVSIQDLMAADRCCRAPVPSAIWLGCYAGPRVGELLALRWSDVDVLHRTVTICRKVIEVSGAGLVEGATKTKAGRRTVTSPRRVTTELEAHRAALPSTALIFTSPGGAQVRAGNPPPPVVGRCRASCGARWADPSTTCAIPQSHCGWRPGPPTWRWRSGPGTALRPSPRAAMPTFFLSTARRWPTGWTPSSPLQHPLRRPRSSTSAVSDVHQMCTRRAPARPPPENFADFTLSDPLFVRGR